MMFSPTALMKPTITALETNRSRKPSFSSPAASITTPVMTASVHNPATIAHRYHVTVGHPVTEAESFYIHRHIFDL